ncbi:MAG: hypothetical protein ABSG63_01320 [Spirochaetia bacterium]
MKKKLCAAALLIAAVFIPAAFAQQSPSPATGFTLGTELGGGYENLPNRIPTWYDLLGVDFAYTSAFFDMGGAFHMTNDGKYTPTEGWMVKAGNQYMMLDLGYTRLHYGGLAFEAGYLKPVSSVETPYEVFLNPLAPSSFGMVLSWETSGFLYESRYIAVNTRSSNTYDWGPASMYNTQTWLDKGVNYRLIALKFGDLRIGYEESSVYLRSFDPNYFFSPLPSVLTNTLLTQGHNPWTQGNSGNDNSLMGLFSDYRSGPLYAEAQLLIDDINLNFLFPPGSPFLLNNENKLAWSIGGKYKFPFGTIGFWHGGATAYTYEASYSNYNAASGPINANTVPYEYMYYPTVVWNGNIIDPRDSNIGFPWGENAIAFKVTFDTDLFTDQPWAFALDSSLEYVISGSKSPDKPWNQYGDDSLIPQRIQLFNVFGPETLEQVLILHAGATKQLGDFRVRAGLDIGGDFNAPIVLQLPPNSGSVEPPLLLPLLGNNKLIFAIELSVRYVFTPGAQQGQQ